MSQHEELPPELKAVEAELSSLAPRSDTIDSGRLMFEAGRASVARERRSVRWIWPSAFTAMTAAAALLLVVLIARPGPEVIERIVHVPVGVIEPPELLDTPVSPPPENRPVSDQEETQPHEPQFNRSFVLASANWLRPAPSTYPYLRNQLLIEGVDSWQPDTPRSDQRESETPATYRSWRNEVLNDNSL